MFWASDTRQAHENKTISVKIKRDIIIVFGFVVQKYIKIIGNLGSIQIKTTTIPTRYQLSSKVISSIQSFFVLSSQKKRLALTVANQAFPFQSIYTRNIRNYFSFKISRISVRSISSLEGAGGAGGAGTSSFFFISLLIALMRMNIQMAIIKKSMTVCRNAP